MKKTLLGILIAVVVLGLSGIATAGMLIPASEKARNNGKADNSPVITDTEDGWALATPGLEKIVFIHYKKGFAKPPWAGGGKDKPKENKCYEFLGRGVEWTELSVGYVIDPDNLDGLTEDFVINAMFLGAEEWDNYIGVDLFGSYTVDYNASWDSSAPDGRNELLFGDYPEAGVIGVTVIWGYFSGPPKTRKIVEFDILFDTDFAWGDAALDSSVMDLQNIATHELGHGVGLGDLYETTCIDETMYGYSDFGEIAKRDLNAGDIKGIQELYGL
jgi:hypothetical protein